MNLKGISVVRNWHGHTQRYNQAIKKKETNKQTKRKQKKTEMYDDQANLGTKGTEMTTTFVLT